MARLDIPRSFLDECRVDGEFLSPSDVYRHRMMGEFPVQSPPLQELKLGKPGRDRVRVKLDGSLYDGIVKEIQYSDGSCSPREMSIKLALDGREIPLNNACPRRGSKMDKYEAEVIVNIKTKSVNIYLRLRATETYITADGAEVERKEGQEMPIYMTISREKFDAITAAARNIPLV